MAAELVSVWFDLSVVPRPSRWHELQLPLPSKSLNPAISSGVSLYLPARNASNFDEKELTCADCSYASIDCAQRS
jgi:hypothetical protein